MERSPHPRLTLSARGGTRLWTKCAPSCCTFNQFYHPRISFNFYFKILHRHNKSVWDNSIALWLQWDAEEVKYVTMSHAEHASRKKCFVTLSPVSIGGKNGNVRLLLHLSALQCSSEKRHWRQLWDVLTGYTALVKREQVENDGRRRILQSIPDGADYYAGGAALQLKSSISFYNLFYNSPCCLSWP